MYLIVGLGNPGTEYNKTRHNMGFRVLDNLAKKYDIEISRSKYKGKFGTGFVNGEKIILFKPYTYMNLSGEAVQEIVHALKIDLSEIIVIYDDIDVEPGSIKVRKSGNPGSHNGMKSVTDCLNDKNFVRVRIGTGKPNKGMDLVEYVLGAIDEEDISKLEEGIKLGTEAVATIIEQNIDTAMNIYNVKKTEENKNNNLT